MPSKRVVLLLGLAGFIVMADNWVVSPILPAIAKGVGVRPEAAGVLIVAYMLPFGIFQLVFGPLADRFGKTRVILVTLTAFSMATALCAIGTTVTGVAAFRALTGVFAAATMPISLALIGDLFPMESRQSAIGSFMGISFLGQALSMGIGGAIAYFLDWRGVFIVYGVVAAVITAVLWRALPAATGGRETRDPHAPVLKPYLQLLRSGSSVRTYLMVLLEGALLIGSFSYLGALLVDRFGLSFLLVGAIMTAFGIGAVLGGRVSNRVAERIGRPATTAAGLATAAAADLIVFAGGASLLVSTVGIFLLGLGLMTAHSTLLTIATEFAAKARGSAMSLVAFAFMGGGAIGTQLGSRIIGGASFGTLYVAYGIGAAVLAAVAVPALRGATDAASPAPAVASVVEAESETV
ncbi:MAG: MFS transporter [Actinomycetia bacterium]|nr:MFS transporter [Actinomycetes bacterium]